MLATFFMLAVLSIRLDTCSSASIRRTWNSRVAQSPAPYQRMAKSYQRWSSFASSLLSAARWSLPSEECPHGHPCRPDVHGRRWATLGTMALICDPHAMPWKVYVSHCYVLHALRPWRERVHLYVLHCYTLHALQPRKEHVRLRVSHCYVLFLP